MGKTSKPVRLIIDQALIDASPDVWKDLIDQGHSIDFLKNEDRIIVAPYAMRMTAAMITDLPKSIELLIKGARALQYSPLGGTEWMKGKPKRVANKKPSKRKNSKVEAQVDDTTSQPVTGGTGPVEGGQQAAGLFPVDTPSNPEGNG